LKFLTLFSLKSPISVKFTTIILYHTYQKCLLSSDLKVYNSKLYLTCSTETKKWKKVTNKLVVILIKVIYIKHKIITYKRRFSNNLLLLFPNNFTKSSFFKTKIVFLFQLSWVFFLTQMTVEGEVQQTKRSTLFVVVLFEQIWNNFSTFYVDKSNRNRSRIRHLRKDSVIFIVYKSIFCKIHILLWKLFFNTQTKREVEAAEKIRDCQTTLNWKTPNWKLF
jgi:hypothetical protein